MKPYLLMAVFEIEPVPWQRVTMFKGRLIQSEKTRSFERDFGRLAKYKMGPRAPIDQPMHVKLTFLIAQPHRFRARAYPDVGNDVDNLTKAVLDGGNKVIWKDDARIVDLTVSKRWVIPRGSIIVEVFSA